MPLRDELGFAHLVSVEKWFAPEAKALRQFNTAALSAVLSVNAAARAPRTPRNAINARDREIGIPRGSPGRGVRG